MTAIASPVARETRIGEFSVCSACSGTVYEARRGDGVIAALKLATRAGPAEHESSVLTRLTGCSTPQALARGVFGDGEYLALSWRRGVDARRAAGELRTSGDRRQALGLCVALLRAYAEIHDRGVVHGNIHPRHVLVDRDGLVSVLDFAAAGATLGTLSAPAQAEAWLSAEEVVAPDPRDEQYSLAALVYLLLCGRTYFRAARDRGSVAHQILAEQPLSFAEHGEPGWPAVEDALAQALSKERSARFESVRDLADELLRAARDPSRRAAPHTTALLPALDQHLSQFRELTRVDGPLITGDLPAPMCSVNYGAAGIAFALHRLACAAEDQGALDAAAAWIDLAERERGTADGLHSDALGLTPASIGTVSPYHTDSGVALVRALMCRHHRDTVGERGAIAAYLARTAAPCSNLDLTVGLCSVILGGALLLGGADPAWEESDRLSRTGDALVASVWAQFPRSGMSALGIAHGWAGVIYATLMWSHVRHVAPPSAARELLDELVRLAEPHGRGLRWPWRSDDSIGPEAYWPGWCGGPAGHVFLWTLAASCYGESDLLDVAERAAWSVWDQPAVVTSLCCGVAGQAYAFLNLYRHAGERSWLDRATALAGRAASSGTLAGDATSPASLYKGHAGLALLAAELRTPHRSAMPLFEPEPVSPPGLRG